MTPDRLKGWLGRIPAGSKTVALSVDNSGQLTELACWERSEVDAAKGTDCDVGDAVIAAAQEYADGEDGRQKFLLQWRGNRSKPLKTVTHWARPKPADLAEEDAPPMTPDEIIRGLLRAQAEKDKVLLNMVAESTKAATHVTTAYERVIAMLTGQLQTVAGRIDTGEAAAVVGGELSPLQEAEIQQRTEALRALTDKLPDLIDLAITAGAKKLMESGDGPAAAAEPAVRAVSEN